ncbi:hypothetical protein [Actinokineospora globicatena]|uniref:Uncharacterized protein n=1 Tax=Actinokineospora globicatena TaxID=103729 RepID=A0A9W6QJU5_9PSEU|nr:hypothetical protein [Actinokineospora globicatena]GLW90837.1 hypothetical protein Aglo03_16530 [Actinokineospora globicatena]
MLGSHPAVVTRMNARIKVFSSRHGEVRIMRNAGGILTDDVVGSLPISQRKPHLSGGATPTSAAPSHSSGATSTSAARSGRRHLSSGGPTPKAALPRRQHEPGSSGATPNVSGVIMDTRRSSPRIQPSGGRPGTAPIKPSLWTRVGVVDRPG